MSRKLHVTQTSLREIADKWGWQEREVAGILQTLLGPVFVRCTRKGHINWDVAPIYEVDELIERNNVIIMTREGTRKHQRSRRARKTAT